MRMRFAVHMIINMKVSGCEFPDVKSNCSHVGMFPALIMSVTAIRYKINAESGDYALTDTAC